MPFVIRPIPYLQSIPITLRLPKVWVTETDEPFTQKCLPTTTATAISRVFRLSEKEEEKKGPASLESKQIKRKRDRH
jgi:hypothetical protein